MCDGVVVPIPIFPEPEILAISEPPILNRILSNTPALLLSVSASKSNWPSVCMSNTVVDSPSIVPIDPTLIFPLLSDPTVKSSLVVNC